MESTAIQGRVGIAAVEQGAAIKQQTERAQSNLERLCGAMDTLATRLQPFMTPGAPGAALLERPDGSSSGMSDQALAMQQVNDGIEAQIDRIQEYAARIDH